MNMVDLRLPGARVLDLFAGSGALGLEALSRGAAHADFVDSDPRSLRTLGRNIAQLGAGPATTVHRDDAARFAAALDAERYDVAFADPPYHQGHALTLAEQWLARPFAKVLGVEHHASERLPEGGATRRYGSTAITFYQIPEPE